uniref:Uncharacterized protein n=1 Tax=Arundo donax TaxID=35708 RepID=A0A0A9CVS7_ARUDO
MRVALKTDWLNWDGKLSCQNPLLYPVWWNLSACRLIRDVVEFASSEVGTAHKFVSFKFAWQLPQTPLRESALSCVDEVLPLISYT